MRFDPKPGGQSRCETRRVCRVRGPGESGSHAETACEPVPPCAMRRDIRGAGRSRARPVAWTSVGARGDM